MSPLVISLIAFGCIVGGMMLGMALRAVLPDHHLSEDSRDVVKLGTGMIATLAALVLGLLIASAKGNFDTMNIGLVHAGSKIILLDRLMAQYGPETREARDLLRRGVAFTIDNISQNGRSEQTETRALRAGIGLETIQDKLRQLSPQNDAQRWLQLQALRVSIEVAEVRWLLVERKGHSELPMPLFVILVFWLVVIFFIFGLLSPRNETAIVILLVCALSAAASLFMMLELDNPFGGLINLSTTPLRDALVYIGQ